ncbi:restriction endonuclease [Candidatus Magnetoovum chiemensis]|nr:restriction endonuclease [Candidatus Magnetoovum chiemensis]
MYSQANETNNLTLLEKEFDLTEIINAEEVMSPSPFRRHQRIIINLSDIISPYAKRNKIGRVYTSPLDVIFEDGANRLQPDLLFIRNDNTSIEQDWINGIPDMVCEVISQASYYKDTVTKKNIYEKYKVPEYWIVIPELKTIEILTLEDNIFKPFSIAAIEGMVQSKVMKGLNINIKEVFED